MLFFKVLTNLEEETKIGLIVVFEPGVVVVNRRGNFFWGVIIADRFTNPVTCEVDEVP